MKKLYIFFSRIHANHKIKNIAIGIIIIILCLFVLEGALQKVGVIVSSIITSYMYNLFADTKKQLEEEATRMEQEEMIR